MSAFQNTYKQKNTSSEKPFYLMESVSEGQRLLMKSDSKSTRSLLIKSKLKQVKTPFQIVDAGSGVGFVSKIMADILKNKEGKGTSIFKLFRKN